MEEDFKYILDMKIFSWEEIHANFCPETKRFLSRTIWNCGLVVCYNKQDVIKIQLKCSEEEYESLEDFLDALIFYDDSILFEMNILKKYLVLDYILF